jgi:hypothetical protein
MALTRVNFAGQGQNVLQSSSMPVGSVLQVLNMVTDNNTAHSTLNTYTNTNMTLSITPSSTSNKILVISSFSVRSYHNSYNSWGRIGLFRDSTLIMTRDSIKDGGNNQEVVTTPSGFVHLDSPSSTSALTYLIKGKLIVSTNYNAQLDIGEHRDDSDEINQQSLTLMEIKG